MIRVLSIGNSFSQDAQRYLHKIAKNEGVDIKCVNIYIGGCSLRRHYLNMLDDKAEYNFEFNGEDTGIKVGISQALSSDDWDYITLQQVSHLAPFYDTYVPYITKLAEYVRMYTPKAKLLFHQTWAYEQNSDRMNNELGFEDQHDMLDKIKESYTLAAKEIKADGIIPSGAVMMEAIDSGIGKVHRDTFHADLGIGRYLLGLTWYTSLTGKTAKKDFTDFDVPVDRRKIAIVRNAVNNVKK